MLVKMVTNMRTKLVNNLKYFFQKSSQTRFLQKYTERKVVKLKKKIKTSFQDQYFSTLLANYYDHKFQRVVVVVQVK